MAVISQLSTICLFSQWILIFSIFSYTVFLAGVLRLIQCLITGYLLTSFSHFFGSKNTVIVIAKYYMIECSSTVLLTQYPRSRTRCQWSYIWGMVLRCDLVSHFLTEIWDRRCWRRKSWHFLSHFQSENGSNGYRCSEREVFPKRIYNFTSEHTYRISSNRSRALNTSRASNAGWGSDVIVLIEARGFYSRKYGMQCMFLTFWATVCTRSQQ